MQWWFFFSSNDKSRTEADSKGYLSSVQNSDLAFNILRYNFFHTDYRAVEEEEMKAMDVFKTVIPNITEHSIYDKYTLINYTFPQNSKKGIKPNKPEDINKTKYALSELKNSCYGYLMDIDSLKSYAQKAIQDIKKQYH